MKIVEMFAGPGGWSEGARQAGVEGVGIEWEPDACATRQAAGHLTVRADLFDYELPERVRLDGLIASPPCPLFSSAGKGEGGEWLDALCLSAQNDQLTPDGCPPEAALTLTPMRWALKHRPTWIAWEQVPAVLPIWRACATRLRAEGWYAWAGVLCAADFGVPQTRNRAFLIASKDKPVAPPTPTHSELAEPSLFGEIKPWVSMAEALGWGLVQRPAFTVASGTTGGPDVIGGSGARNAIREAQLSDEEWVKCAEIDSGQNWKRSIGQPAPTLTGKSPRQWVIGVDTDWCWTRPATTACGDPRLGEPGHRDRDGGEPQFKPDAIKLSVQEAAALQSFPADYPWQGSKTSKFHQIGNAVPPMLAKAIIEVLA